VIPSYDTKIPEAAMRRRSAADSLWLAGWTFLLAGAVGGCDRPGPRAFGQDEQDDAAPTPDPLPGVARVSDATPDQLKAACRGLSVESLGIRTSLEDNAFATIAAAKGNHKITEADLSKGRMTARIVADSGPGIRRYGIEPGDTACTLIVGPSYDALETMFVSVNKGVVATFLTTVIHKAKAHPHADADWLSIDGPPLLAPEKESGARGMIPWLLPPGNKLKVSQTGCGKYQCCVQSQPK
jgi:hypothetical protein